MTSKDTFSLLPKADQDELLQLILDKLSSARQESIPLRVRLTELENSIHGYEQFIESLGLSNAIDIVVANDQDILVVEAKNVSTVSRQAERSTITELFDKGWTQGQKIQFVLRNPERYGEKTFVGAGSVVRALKQEDEELQKEDNAILLKRFGPTLSRMAQNQEVLKAVELNNLTRVHYISSEWLDKGRILTKYQARLAGLKVVNLPGPSRHIKKTAAVTAAAEPEPELFEENRQ